MTSQPAEVLKTSAGYGLADACHHPTRTARKAVRQPR